MFERSGTGKAESRPAATSARRGTYRVIYRIDDAERTVTVVDIAHRRDVAPAV